jgi:hypothetical protein
MNTVREPVIQIEYESKDITRYIAPYVMSLTYTDYEHGHSDDLEIQLEDSEHLWQSSWYPSKGDTISAKIGYVNEDLLNCGSFEIDEVEFSAPPDTITIKALSTSIKKALRQKNTALYENKTLVDIAGDIGKKYGFTVVGSEGFVKIGRITQNQQHDLTFLKKLAESYGYIFKIAGGKLVFYKVETLQNAAPLLIFHKNDLKQVNIRDKTSETYSACTVQYFDSKTKSLHSTTVNSPNCVKGDTLKLTERCESKTQAQLKANAALTDKNSKAIEGSIVAEGNINAIAGVNIELKDLYNFSGKYHITQSTHTIAQIYECTAEIKKIG